MKKNPSNPATQDSTEIQAELPKSIERGRIIDVPDSNEGGVHFATVKLYDDNSQRTMPVLTPSYGDISIPESGSDVMVLFGDNNTPVVIGHWYSIDRVLNGQRELPPYEEGERVVGNGTGSDVRIKPDGSIEITTDALQPVNIDHQTGTLLLSQDYSLSDDNTYYKLPFDTTDSENDPEQLYSAADNGFVVRDSGQHRVAAHIEIEAAGQNNLYTLTLFKNGAEWRRTRKQSSVNEQMTIEVDTQRPLEKGDVITVHMRQDSGSAKIVNSNPIATEFTIRRNGI